MTDDAQRWEVIARDAPYWGVLSADEFRGSPSASALTRFWGSGDSHLKDVDAILARSLGRSAIGLKSALDFGCGVGRVLLPLAKRAGEVIGIDVAPTMLAEADTNLRGFGVTNFSLFESLDRVPAGSVQFVHSVLVIQHIPPQVGYEILSQLVSKIEPGGFAFLQLFVRRRATPARRLAQQLRNRYNAVNTISERALNRPAARYRMYEYDVYRVLELFKNAGIGDVVMYPTISENQYDVVFVLRAP